MNEIGALDLEKITKKGATTCNKLNKNKKMWKIKGKDMCRWKATEMLHTQGV